MLSRTGRHTLSEQKTLLVWLGAICGFVWIAAAIHPLDHQAWILENILLVIFVVALALTYRRLQLSKASYLLLAAFVLLHIIGAHYTYARMPAGLWARDYFGLSRNHYDRAIHFSFGFLLLYPMRELLIRSAHAYRYWATWLAVAALCALSSFFEIIEAVVAQIVAPDLGIAYLGTQGDVWDAQKDMGAAFLGAVIVASCLILYPRSDEVNCFAARARIRARKIDLPLDYRAFFVRELAACCKVGQCF